MNTISRFVGVSLADFKKFEMGKNGQKKPQNANKAPDGQKASEPHKPPENSKIDTDAEITAGKWITKGLHNRKNDCYALALLQFLFLVAPFRDSLLAHPQCEGPKDPEVRECSTCILKKILVFYMNTEDSILQIPEHLLDQILVEEETQNDPSEQLNFLLGNEAFCSMLHPLFNYGFSEKVSPSFIYFYLFIKKITSITASL